MAKETMNWNKFVRMSNGDLSTDWLVRHAMGRISNAPIGSEDIRAFVTRRVGYIAWRPVSKLDLDRTSGEYTIGNSWTRHNFDIHYSIPGEPPPGASRAVAVTGYTTVAIEMRSLFARCKVYGYKPILGYVVHEVATGDPFCGLDKICFDVYTLITSDFKVPGLTV
jgi:hypothetical protein